MAIEALEESFKLQLRISIDSWIFFDGKESAGHSVNSLVKHAM